MLLIAESVLYLKEKSSTTLIFLLSTFNDEIGILLLDYRIKFSSLYIPQGHLWFHKYLWLWSTDEYYYFLDFEQKSTFNDNGQIIYLYNSK